MRYHSRFKTLGPQAARLVTALYERGRPIFALADVKEITGLTSGPARAFAHKLAARGIAVRLRPGLFALVPFELGRATEYMGNLYVVARELAGGQDYYLSHASAMDIHGMTTQPQFVVYITLPRIRRSRPILGTMFRFVYCERKHFFGIVQHWVEKHEQITVSDRERTVLDGLRQPEYCGGITEVAKGLWIRRAGMDPTKLVDYALRFRIGAVIRRLGYLMETYGIGTTGDLERLRRRLTPTYSLLDPVLPQEGRFFSRWRLRLNVPPEELQAVKAT